MRFMWKLGASVLASQVGAQRQMQVCAGRRNRRSSFTFCTRAKERRHVGRKVRGTDSFTKGIWVLGAGRFLIFSGPPGGGPATMERSTSIGQWCHLVIISGEGLLQQKQAASGVFGRTECRAKSPSLVLLASLCKIRGRRLRNPPTVGTVSSLSSVNRSGRNKCSFGVCARVTHLSEVPCQKPRSRHPVSL